MRLRRAAAAALALSIALLGAPGAGARDRGDLPRGEGDSAGAPDPSARTGAPSDVDAGKIPATGDPVPGLEPFDKAMRRIMKRYDIPGGALAVAHDGRLVYARGFGWADEQFRQRTDPQSLFRIASISKPFTATAVMDLVEQGLLGLDDRAFDLLGIDVPADADPRLLDITVEDLLRHSGGWDRDVSGDPMFDSWWVSDKLGETGPATCEMTIRYMLTVDLDFAPGESYGYSNVGYCILGRIIEAVTGADYGQHIEETVLEPVGIADMALGRTRFSERLPGEVRYYAPPGAGRSPSIFPPDYEMVAWPYGLFSMEAFDSAGGWVGSAVDLLRFVNSLSGQRPGSPLEPATFAQMIERPDMDYWEDMFWWYGFGLIVEDFGDGTTFWHDGSLPGSTSVVVHTGEGVSWAALFNRRDFDWGAMFGEVNSRLWSAYYSVTGYPEDDLFPQYTGAPDDVEVPRLKLREVTPSRPQAGKKVAFELRVSEQSEVTIVVRLGGAEVATLATTASRPRTTLRWKTGGAAPGRYSFEVTAVDVAGNPAAPVEGTFRLR